MIQQVEAVWEHGVLRPLDPVSLAESQRVSITIADFDQGRSKLDPGILEWAGQEVAKGIAEPTIEEVRAALADMPGSLEEAVYEDRKER